MLENRKSTEREFSIERTMSAPPQNTPSPAFEFILTNEKGSPIEISDSSETERSEVKEIPQEDELSSEFIKFMEIEQLLREFPHHEKESLTVAQIKGLVNEIYRNTERTELPIRFLTAKTQLKESKDKMDEFKNKVYSPVETMKYNLNRVTKDNKESVLRDITDIKVTTVAEMQDISALMLEKIITEPVYLDVYIWLIGQLRSDWKCIEEKESKEQKPQSCFFGKLLSMAMTKVKTPHNWGIKTDIGSLKATSRADLEEQIEEIEMSRNKKKRQVIASLSLFVKFYCLKIIGFANVKSILEYLLPSSSEEHVEMLSHVYKDLHRCMSETHPDLLDKVTAYLSGNMKKYGIRIELLVEGVLPTVSKGIRPTKSTNSFASLMEEDLSSSGSKGIRPAKSNNSFASLMEVEEASSSADSDAPIIEYIQKCSAAVELISFDDEILEYGAGIVASIPSYPIDVFMLQYIIEMTTNHKVAFKFMKMAVEAISVEFIFYEHLLKFKDELNMYSMDFPRCSKFYCEFIIRLRLAGRLTKEEFETLKPNDFFQKSSECLKAMKEAKTPNLNFVVTDSELDGI